MTHSYSTNGVYKIKVMASNPMSSEELTHRITVQSEIKPEDFAVITDSPVAFPSGLTDVNVSSLSMFLSMFTDFLSYR